jgi:hypothetical protein
MASKPPETPEAVAETFLVQAMVREAFRRLDPEVMAVLDERRSKVEVREVLSEARLGRGPNGCRDLDTRSPYNQVGHRQETSRDGT